MNDQAKDAADHWEAYWEEGRAHGEVYTRGDGQGNPALEAFWKRTLEGYSEGHKNAGANFFESIALKVGISVYVSKKENN